MAKDVCKLNFELKKKLLNPQLIDAKHKRKKDLTCQIYDLEIY